MAIDKVVDSAQLDAAMTATANAIRTQGGTSAQIEWKQTTGFAEAIGALSNITLTSIEIVTPPSKTQYAVGESPDTTGAVLKATYSNGATRTLTSGWTASFDFGGTGSATLSDSAVTFQLTEGGHTATCDSPIEVLNPITISATVETGRAVVDTRTLRAITYYDGDYIAVETTSAEQVYFFKVPKDSPTNIGSAYISNTSRPYPASCVAADGTYVYVGVTLGRGTTPYSNRYLLKIPQADLFSGTWNYTSWNGEGYSIEAISGLDATNGYFTIVGSKNGVGSIGRVIPTAGTSSFSAFSGQAPFDDVCAAGAGVVFVSEEDARISYAANTATYSSRWITVDNAPPVKVAANGSTVVTLTRGNTVGNTFYSARNVDISSGTPSVTGRYATGKVADENAEIVGLEAVGDYFVVVSKSTDGSTWMAVLQPSKEVTYTRMYQLNVTNPVALCKTDDGVTVVGQVNGKYTITQLTVE